MIAASIFKQWRGLNHTKTYILTNGMGTDPQGLETSGLGPFISYIEANK